MDTHVVMVAPGMVVSQEMPEWEIPPEVARRSPFPTMPADPTAEYLAGGNSTTPPGTHTLLSVLSWLLDDVDRNFGDDVTRRMLNDPAVAACVQPLALSVAEHDLTLDVPARFRTVPGQKQGPDRAELDAAKRVLDFNRRCLDELRDPIEDTLQAMGDFPAWGCNLAEIVYEPIVLTAGEPPRIVPVAIKPKAREAWQFLVDSRWNVIGIYAMTDQPGTWVVLPPEKFMWLTWLPRSGDPRGTRIIRPGFNAWHAKMRSGPELLRFLGRFGSPSVVGKPSPTATAEAEPGGVVSESGVPARSRTKTPAQRLLEQLVQWVAQQILVVPNGTEVELIEPKGDGTAFLTSLDYWDRQIVLAIYGSVRGVLESRYGSRADSETGQDVAGLVKKACRRIAARAVAWQLLYRLNVLNFGEQMARAYTPAVSLGGVEDHDIVAEATAWAKAGYQLSSEQMYEIDARLGLTPRTVSPENAMQRNSEDGEPTE